MAQHSATAPLKVLVSAGEPSGDEHAASLCAVLRQLVPELQLKGMGGRHLRAVGTDTVIDAEQAGAIMGFQEVLSSAGTIYATYRRLCRLLREWQPHVLLIVDYPDFNFLLARTAKRAGVKVFYFIPPQLWAWRSGRIRTMQRYVDRAGVIFPFEPDYYRSRGYAHAHFVGHPAVEHVKQAHLSGADRQDFLRSHGLDPKRPVLALLPGSRTREIDQHLPLLIDAFKIVAERLPAVQGAIPAAPSLESTLFNAVGNTPIKLIRGEALRLMQAADAGLVKSGTSNLQAALAGLPFAMLYRAPRLTGWIARAVIPVQSFCIVNFIRKDTIKEFVQEDATPSNLADEACELLMNSGRRTALKAQLAEVTDALTLHHGTALEESPSLAAAKLLFDLVQGQPATVHE